MSTFLTGLSFSGFAHDRSRVCRGLRLWQLRLVHKLSEYCVRRSMYCQGACVWSWPWYCLTRIYNTRHVIGTEMFFWKLWLMHGILLAHVLLKQIINHISHSEPLEYVGTKSWKWQSIRNSLISLKSDLNQIDDLGVIIMRKRLL